MNNSTLYLILRKMWHRAHPAEQGVREPFRAWVWWGHQGQLAHTQCLAHLPRTIYLYSAEGRNNPERSVILERVLGPRTTQEPLIVRNYTKRTRTGGWHSCHLERHVALSTDDAHSPSTDTLGSLSVVYCIPEEFNVALCESSWSLLIVKVAPVDWLLIVGADSLMLPFSSLLPLELCWIRSWPKQKLTLWYLKVTC